MSYYTEEELKNFIKKGVQEALNMERSQIATQRPQQGDAHHSMEAIDDCPECHAAFKVDKFKTDTVRKMWNERRALHAKCKTCGLPMKVHGRDGHTKETEDATCPLCGSSEAEDRYVFE